MDPDEPTDRSTSSYSDRSVGRRPIERVASLGREELERTIHEQRPLILTDWSGAGRARSLPRVGDVRAAFPDLELDVREPYTPRRTPAAGRPPAPHTMTLSAYLALIVAHPETPLLCLEQETPAEIAALFDHGEYDGINAASGDTVASRLFVGNAGNCSNLHFDRDYHATLLHQVCGRKRVVLISPQESQKLRPVTNFSEFRLQNFAAPDLDAFFDYTSAFVDNLAPGETLLIPTAHWHHVEYVDDAISVNFKLRRNAHLRLFGGGLFHTNFVAQALATRLVDPAGGDTRDALMGRLVEVLVDPSLGAFERFDAMEAAFREMYHRWCPGWPPLDRIVALGGRQESSLWRDDLASGRLYGLIPADAVAAG